MRPKADQQLKWGLGAAAIALLVVLVLALVPDPFFRQKVYGTTFDDVESLTRGTPVYFRGAAIGSVRKVSLAPETRNFAIQLGVTRDFRPSPCTFTRIAAANPFTAPRIELVSVETSAQACPAALTAQNCDPLKPPSGAPRGLTGCRRAPDLIATATAAVTQAAEVAKSANAIALQVQAMIPKAGGGPKVDVDAVVKDVTHTLASIDAMTSRLNASLTPGKGDIAQTLANVRTASNQAASIDVPSVNATIKRVESIMADNQARIDTLLTESAALSTDTRTTLENLSASLSVTAGNLQRTTESLDALSARLSDDPTYVLRGQRFSDPDQGKKK